MAVKLIYQTFVKLLSWMVLHARSDTAKIGCDRRIDTAAGPLRADELAAALPRHAWHRLSAGPGAKGHRVYDWA